MISFEYAAVQIKAVWTIAFEHKPVTTLDLTTEGVFNSFWAMVYAIIPALFVYGALRAGALGLTAEEAPPLVQASPFLYFPTQIISSAAVWVASLFALSVASQNMQAGRKVTGVLIAYNWSNLISLLLACVPALILMLTRSFETYILVLLPMAFVNIFILWRLLRATLETDVGVTIALLIALFLVEIAVNGTVIGAASLLI